MSRKRPKRKVAKNEKRSNKKSSVSHYAVLIGPLAGLLYPLPFATHGDNRIALNTSKLNKLWGSICVRAAAAHAANTRGLIRLPDRFAKTLDYDPYRIRKGPQGGLLYYSKNEREKITYRRDKPRTIEAPRCDFCGKASPPVRRRRVRRMRCLVCKKLYCYRCRGGVLRCLHHAKYTVTIMRHAFPTRGA